ncbi:MAG: heparinase II/III family protein [Armatimonadota bacterium]|nr:MAG: heparinase II/III family protein [Armatimonadota bacterium]
MTIDQSILIVPVLLLLAVPCASGEQNPLATLRPGHPRLLASDDDIRRLRAVIASDATAREWHDYLRTRADEMLGEPPVEYKLIGPRLLHVSREALRRIATLALIYRLDGERAHADRAIREMMTICAFKDWHPFHFLDTAEMTHAAAVGYDWLYDSLTPEQRATITQAIVDKGLKPALDRYERSVGWTTGTHNWTQVCNGGIGIGALAIADEEPELAAAILNFIPPSLRKSLDEYSPDGAWGEGPGYWGYGSRYSAYLLAALDSALGADFGLSDHPGLALAGDFRVYSCGPTYRTFNFADASERVGGASQMFWFARRYRKPLYSWFERQVPASPDPWALLWYDAEGDFPPDLPLDKLFRGVEVAFLRSAWADPNAVFIGFKGGQNPYNHGHLDLGTFVLDALGQRWATELGADDYNLPGYFFEPQRWTYYRNATAGQNTLMLNGENQALPAKAPMIAFHSAPQRAFAVADLSTAYPMTKKVWRGVTLLDRKHVLIQDDIETGEAVDVEWAMHTPAAVSLDGATATLTQGEASLTARVLSPNTAEFAIASADPGPPQKRNEGITKLVVRLPGVSGEARLAILLTPEAAVRAPALTPLAEWVKLAGQE